VTGGIYTSGPLYRPEGAPERDYRPPQMPTRYQPRDVQMPAIGLRPSAELVCGYRSDQTRAPTITSRQCERANAARSAATKPVVDRGSLDSAAKPSMTQKILKRLKGAKGWVDVLELIAIAPDRLDAKGVSNLLHRYRGLEQVVTRRADDGTRLEYCWGAIARAGDQSRQVKGRSMSPNSLTFWICSVLRTDRTRWMSTEEIAESVGTMTTAIEQPTPSIVSNRLSPLLRSGRLEKRPREGAKHGHGSTMEYRLTTAF
jgi:hypothetical protein